MIRSAPRSYAEAMKAKTIRHLLYANAAAALLVGFLVWVAPRPLPAAENAKPWETKATIQALGFAFAGMGFALLFLDVPVMLRDRRRLATGLAFGNCCTACILLIQQTQIWRSPWGWPLVLTPALLTVGFTWAALQAPDPQEAAPEPGVPEPGDLQRGWLRQLGQATAQEERNRLARDLHDSIKQQIFAIRIGAATAEERWESDPAGARAALGHVQRSAHEALVEMDALLQQLRPRALAGVGLAEALREQCEALGYRTGAEVTLEASPALPDERLPPGAQETLFRMAQEALANVARHARARAVRVDLGVQGETVRLRVQDEGQGFDAAAAPPGMGLRNLEERARGLGGRCTVASAPGAGTTVEAEIPLLPRRQA